MTSLAHYLSYLETGIYARQKWRDSKSFATKVIQGKRWPLSGGRSGLQNARRQSRVLARRRSFVHARESAAENCAADGQDLLVRPAIIRGYCGVHPLRFRGNSQSAIFSRRRVSARVFFDFNRCYVVLAAVPYEYYRDTFCSPVPGSGASEEARTIRLGRAS
jgi:hypothetical protein